MVEAKPPDATGATCVSCDKKAVIVLVVKWRNWSTTTALCESCRGQAVKSLSPLQTSKPTLERGLKKDLQHVWNMAAEMSGANEYSDYDEAYGTRLGVSEPFRSAINRVKKFFSLKGKDVA